MAFNKIWTPEYDIALTNLPFLAKIPGIFKNLVDRLKSARTLAEEIIYYAPKVIYMITFSISPHDTAVI